MPLQRRNQKWQSLEEGAGKRCTEWGLCPNSKALVYDILPSTTAVFSYAIGSRKLSANDHFFVGAQTAVNLLQTTQIKQGVSFIAANKVYTSTNKTTTFESIRNSFFLFFFLPGVDPSRVYVRA